MRRADGWAHVAVVLAGVVGVASLPAGPWQPAAEVGVYLLGVTAVAQGLRRNRPTAALGWRLLAAALAAFALSSAAEAAELAGVAPGASGAVESGLDVAGYGALLAAALAALVAGRGRRNPGAWADTATLLLAAGLAVATFVDGPDGLGQENGELTLGLPLLSAVVLVAGVRVALPGNGRSVSGVAVCVAGALALAGWAAKLTSTAGELPPLLEYLPLLAVAPVALAANHPSSRNLGRAPDPDSAFTAGRIVGLGAALLVSPALVLLWTVRHGGNGYLLGAGIGLLTALALWRLGRLDSERHHAQAALAASDARLRVLLENAADVIAIVDAAGRVTYVSPAVGSLLGRTAADVLGRRALAMVDPGDRTRLLRAIVGRPASAGEVVDADVPLRHADGTTRWVEAKVSGRVSAPGVEGWVVNLREVTDRKLLEEELRHRAGTDPLTGLVNRAEFWHRLTVATAAIDPGACPAVLFVDLDGFKAVNDVLGHAAGDELLVAVAGRLSNAVRSGDCVARLGGDEFAVLLGAADAERLRRVGDRLVDALREPVRLGGRTAAVTASVGGTLAIPGDTPETLLHRADTAMYAAKRDGKDRIELHSPAGAPAAV
ncbi:sensor domain-containing diguanylate cyclase [Geodermatophilus sp. DF01-2]|uniref:sensor domain-containing diguanylate cyclase n=1 Tax=Geodermatophilus sp. DF01-2 TaxID=2559610 RepID=UPI0010746FEB|nr:sensor domain-containing diguanylate cyclase [Geodermatophilus sp. DF01_2]TFV56653.1 sensor domain-containing diguanylate cyclase [Geodermatophilus sp. DF01_2]